MLSSQRQRIAAVWVGNAELLFLAAVFSWIIFGITQLAGLDVNFHRTVELLYGAAVVTDFTGFSMPAGRALRGRLCGLRTCRRRGVGEERP